MLRYLIFGITLFLGSASMAQQASIDYRKLSDADRLKAAKEIAHATIVVDGHVDLPFRMKVGGFTLKREVLDVSVRTPDGNFDYPRAKEGDLMRHLCPSIFLQLIRPFGELPKH